MDKKLSLHNRSENTKRDVLADLGILIFLLRVRYNHVVYASRDDAKLCAFLANDLTQGLSSGMLLAAQP